MAENNIIDQTYLKSNIIDETQAKREIRDSLGQIAEAITKSLGPYGSTTIIEDTIGEHVMSKDGYTILKRISYAFNIPKTVLDIVKKVSRSLVRTVGDGSTSSVLIAERLFNAVDYLVTELKIAPQDIIEILNVLVTVFEEAIKENAIPIREENFDDIITKIAAISTNNNSEAGTLICNIFKEVGKYGFINLEEGKTSVDEFELVQGIEINRGYINQIMANCKDRFSFEYENAMVFMCNDILADTEMEYVAEIISKVCIEKDIPLVIVAKNYTESFKGFFHANLQKHKHLPLVAIDIDCTNKRGRERFEDLALALGCKFYDKFSGIQEITEITLEDLGVCEKVTGNDLHCKFIGGYGYTNQKDVIDEKIAELEEEYEKLALIDDQEDREVQLYEIKKRIATLTSSMATLYVGGNTPTEKNTRKYLMEDAVYACRSAIENGYIVGGNLILPKILHKDMDSIVDKVIDNSKLKYLLNVFKSEEAYKNAIITILKHIKESFLDSYRKVLSNAHMPLDEINRIIETCLNENSIYNVKLRQYEPDTETLVINSTETDIEIIKASFSIIGLLATSNQFITTGALGRQQ